MPEWIAIGISTLAFLVSGVTAWLTLFRAGDLRVASQRA